MPACVADYDVRTKGQISTAFDEPKYSDQRRRKVQEAVAVEDVALSRDTTESDLKQRREILGGTAHYIEDPAVNIGVVGAAVGVGGILTRGC